MYCSEREEVSTGNCFAHLLKTFTLMVELLSDIYATRCPVWPWISIRDNQGLPTAVGIHDVDAPCAGPISAKDDASVGCPGRQGIVRWLIGEST